MEEEIEKTKTLELEHRTVDDFNICHVGRLKTHAAWLSLTRSSSVTFSFFPMLGSLRGMLA